LIQWEATKCLCTNSCHYLVNVRHRGVFSLVLENVDDFCSVVSASKGVKSVDLGDHQQGIVQKGPSLKSPKRLLLLGINSSKRLQTSICRRNSNRRLQHWHNDHDKTGASVAECKLDFSSPSVADNKWRRHEAVCGSPFQPFLSRHFSEFYGYDPWCWRD